MVSSIYSMSETGINLSNFGFDNHVFNNLSAAIREGDIDSFSKNIKAINLNDYIKFEKTEVLGSVLLLGFCINPDLQNGDEFIREILAQRPNLNLPMMKLPADFPMNRCRFYLEMARNRCISDLHYCEPSEAEELKTVLSRVEMILNYIDYNQL